MARGPAGCARLSWPPLTGHVHMMSARGGGRGVSQKQLPKGTLVREVA